MLSALREGVMGVRCEHEHMESVAGPGWKEEQSSFFIECPESHPRGLPRPLAGGENQFNSLPSNVLFILQVTINSKINLRVYVHERAAESLKPFVAIRLGSASPREEGAPLASRRPGSSPVSPGAGSSGGLIPPSLAADPSGCGEGWGGGGGFGAVEVTSACVRKLGPSPNLRFHKKPRGLAEILGPTHPRARGTICGQKQQSPCVEEIRGQKENFLCCGRAGASVETIPINIASGAAEKS